LSTRSACAGRKALRRSSLATEAADTGALRFYQRVGFRMLAVERDAFTPKNGYPGMAVEGVPLRDRVRLSLEVE